MTENKVITDYGYFTIEDGKYGETMWFHSEVAVRPLRIENGCFNEDIASGNMKLLEAIGENNSFKLTYMVHDSKRIYLDNRHTRIEELTDEDRFKMEVVSDRAVKTYSGKLRMVDGMRCFDAERVDGKEKNIPGICLVSAVYRTPDYREAVRRTAIQDMNEKALDPIPEGGDIEITARLGLNRANGKLCIYLSDKRTMIPEPGMTVDDALDLRAELIEMRLSDVKRPSVRNSEGEETYLCKVAGVMAENSDGSSRKEIIKDMILGCGRNNRVRRPGRLITDGSPDDIRQAIGVFVDGMQIGFVPSESKALIHDKGLAQSGSVLVELKYYPDRDICSGRLYAPDTLPTAKMETTVRKVLKQDVTLKAPERTFIAYCRFLDEHI